jgi:ketosteroid isomerase-like protein
VSLANVEIVREHFMSTNRRDWNAVMAAYDEEIVLVVDDAMAPDAGVVVGREAVGRWFGDWFLAFGKDYRFELDELRSTGQGVLAVAKHHGTGRSSGVEVHQTSFNLYTLHADKITRIELYGSRARALEAVGLSEQAMSANAVDGPTKARRPRQA